MPRKGQILSKADYIQRYGEEIGLKKWQNISTRKRVTLNQGDLENEVLNGNAIKCQQCGAITTRLQHTHFRYKCTIKSITEYVEKFPGFPTVAPNLAKNTAITREKMIDKYGEDDGALRWQKYKNRQAETNTFEYKVEKYGWSKNDFNKFNESRACTLENFVLRHGETAGLIKWKEYCERQKYTTSKEYFIEKYGIDDGLRRFSDFCRGRNCLEFKNGLEKEVLTELNLHLVDKLSYQFHISGIPGCFDFGRDKKVIEFNGDYWHCNPLKYKPDFFHAVKQKTALQIWESDCKKHLSAKKAGYDVMVIWENEWKCDKNNVIKNTIRWLNGN